MTLPDRLYSRIEVQEVFDTGMAAIGALMNLVTSCKELDVCLTDPVANGYDGATTRAKWRQSLAKAEAVLNYETLSEKS